MRSVAGAGLHILVFWATLLSLRYNIVIEDGRGSTNRISMFRAPLLRRSAPAAQTLRTEEGTAAASSGGERRHHVMSYHTSVARCRLRAAAQSSTQPVAGSQNPDCWFGRRRGGRGGVVSTLPAGRGLGRLMGESNFGRGCGRRGGQVGRAGGENFVFFVYASRGRE